ncbi:MAG: PepSY domain-containing protein [bacterium]|jgi:uncharacterized membrane protein YkoI
MGGAMKRISFRAAWLGAGLVALAVVPASAECLSPNDARDLVTSGAVVRLADAARSARDAVEGEMIGGRLCSDGGGYVYVVTILQPDGRVARVTVDAQSGSLLNVR